MHDPELLHERALVRFWPTSDNVQTVLLVIMDVYQRNDWVLLAPLHQINRLLRTHYQCNNYACCEYMYSFPTQPRQSLQDSNYACTYNFQINIMRIDWSYLNLYFGWRPKMKNVSSWHSRRRQQQQQQQHVQDCPVQTTDVQDCVHDDSRDHPIDTMLSDVLRCPRCLNALEPTILEPVPITPRLCVACFVCTQRFY